MTVPVPPDRLIGRRQELARLAELRRTARLITVRGPAGAGKTRLVLEYVRQAANAYWVELGPLRDPVALEPVIATAVGAGEQPGRPAADTIVAALCGRPVLLVLDNCEHLIDAVARLVGTLLVRCADLTVLATSREPLDVPGETLLRLDPLPLPEPGDEPQRSDVVRLFAERASVAAPGFAVTEDNAQVVARICVRLDGLPLAIELAAGRVRHLAPAEILHRLNDRLRLLVHTGDPGDARHRDLQAAISWSYELLCDDEKSMFRRLSVLSGGFGLDAAAAVHGSGAVLGLINDLEAKSLLSAVPGRPGRFRQLESIRLFAHDQLVAAGELSATRERAVAWLAELADRYARQAFPTIDVLGPLDAERDNLLAALGWEPGKQLLFASASAACWRERGQFGLGRRLLDAALDSPRPREYRSLALAQAAVLATDVGDGARARELAEAAVALDRAAGAPVALVRSVSRLAGACFASGDVDSAVRYAAEAVALARVHGQEFDRAVCLHNLAYIRLHAGELAEAAELLAECLPVCRTRPEPWLHVGALHSAGTLALAQDDFETAGTYFREALAFATNHVARKIHSVEGLAVVAARRGDRARAVRLALATAALRRTWGMATRAGDPWDERVAAAIENARTGMTQAELRRAGWDPGSLDADAMVGYALSTAGSPDPLTERESEVVRLVAEGHPTRRIALDLGIAERTVETHLDHVRDKLGLRSRPQIAAWWAARQRS